MQTVLVNQVTEENVVWNVVVEVFGLQWNPRARRCYAWGQPKAEGGWDITTVLETRPVVSALTAVTSVISALAAVKVALATKAKPFAA